MGGSGGEASYRLNVVVEEYNWQAVKRKWSKVGNSKSGVGGQGVQSAEAEVVFR